MGVRQTGQKFASPARTPERQFIMSGSETRQRQKMLTIRLTENEHRMLRERADMIGLSLGGYARKMAIGKPGPRSKRQPVAPRDELRRLKGELGRIGNNINQIAYCLNTGEKPVPNELETAIAELAEINGLIRHAMGFRDEHRPGAGESDPLDGGKGGSDGD